jgi:hypothetical protein
MPIYQYVTQGEYFITTDPDTVLLTTGMTECIGFCFIDKQNPNIRLLAHLDGFVLNQHTAKANIAHMITTFQQHNGAREFDIFCAGGTLGFYNYRTLIQTLRTLDFFIPQENITTAKDFCEKFKAENIHTLFSTINISSICAAIICPPGPKPLCLNFNPSNTSGISHENVCLGRGLNTPEAQQRYEEFYKLNDHILKNHPEISQIIRTSMDAKWFEEHKHLLDKPSFSPK